MNKFDFKLWKDITFSMCELDDYGENILPDWPCPYCWKSSLSLESKLVYSVKYPNYAELEQWSYPFNGLLFCNSCKLIVSISGWLSVEIIDHVIEESGYKPIYREIFDPKYFLPNLKLFYIEKYYPKEVCQILEKAFSSFFYDTFATASLLRSAVEKLLDQPELKKNTIKKEINSKKLHNRINDIKNKKVKIKFLAIKWLGNDGAHFDTAKLTKNDILYAFAMMQSILEELYSGHEKDLISKAKKINITHENKNKN